MGGQPVEEAHSAEDLVAGVVDRRAFGGVVVGAVSDSPQHPPRGEGGDGLAVLGAVDGGDGLGVEPLEGEELFVARSEDAVVDEHLADMVRGPRLGMGVEGLMGDSHGAACEPGEDGCARSLTQPVQRFARCRGGGNGVVHGNEVGGHDTVGAGHRFGGAAGKRAPVATAPLVELVLAPAFCAGVHRGEPRAVTAAGGARAGR